jgi:hypothetical protein
VVTPDDGVLLFAGANKGRKGKSLAGNSPENKEQN